jgi:hypothetical protein
MRSVPIAFGMQAERGGQHQVRPVRLQQIGRADVGLEPRGDQRHHIHQRVGRLAFFRRQVRNLLERQNKVGIGM